MAQRPRARTATGRDSADLESWGESRRDNRPVRLMGEPYSCDSEALRRLTDGLTALPQVGDEFAGFRLIGELGSGAFGRVYLARQGDLADRPVALKVSTGCFAESQKLARLQHTHIVPVYSFHRAGQLQAVCMPYFGATTLARLSSTTSASSRTASRLRKGPRHARSTAAEEQERRALGRSSRPLAPVSQSRPARPRTRPRSRPTAPPRSRRCGCWKA